MKSVSAQIAAAMLLATAFAGCASETTTSDSFGSVEVNLIVGSELVTSVEFVVTCGELTLNGEFNVNDEQDPPVWATIMDLPVGVCTVTIIAKDAAGATLCSASKDVTVVENQTIKVNLMVTCIIDGEEPLGNLDIDATFEIIEGNLCPRLYFLNAVPDEVPPEGSVVTVLAEGPDGRPFTSQLTATSGFFGDAGALSTTYTCDAGGTQTISVSVSNEDPACDKSKTFDVTCPGDNLCEGVVCDDTGNDCTVAECNQETGQCEISNVENGISCEAGGIVDLADNGGVEEGTLNGWDTQFCAPGVCEVSNMAATGSFAARLFNDVAPSGAVLKQANKGIGVVQPGDTVTINFAAKGIGVNGGVAFAEFFTESGDNGASSSEILGGGPLGLTDQYQVFTFTVIVGNPANGGVTLQFAAVTGAAEGSTMELFVDDVSMTVEGGGAGTCQEGVCEPSAECTVETVDADCPPTNNECIDPVCNAGTCGTSNNTNACEGGTGTCDGQGNCVPNAECVVDGDCPATGNDCTFAECTNGQCEVSNVADGDSCEGGNGTCNAGVCKLYNGDFESLDAQSATALSGDGWLASGNQFDSDGNFVGNFGTFPAPNAAVSPDTTFYSAVVQGQGGPAQGNQQLSILNDYNCCGSTAGHNDPTAPFETVEALVFQEPFNFDNRIPAELVDQTVTFFFEGKKDTGEFGLGGNTTAQAFMKTLDPNAGFATTRNPTLDTTNLPVDWTGFSLSLDITSDLVGQILQVGFQTVAQQGEPSNNFYDNIMISLSPTP